MNYLNKSDFPFVHDLNRFLDLGHALQILSAGVKHALGPTRLCASHDLSAFEGIQPHRLFSMIDNIIFAIISAYVSRWDVVISFIQFKIINIFNRLNNDFYHISKGNQLREALQKSS